jgi:VIT1/CCC1 family predicted Fe2+/Mn2+ transporter
MIKLDIIIKFMSIIKKIQKTDKIYVRNFIFGIEDSLVSTIGVVSGIAITGADRRTILLTGIILIFVEAFSMGAGSLISEHSVEEYRMGKHRAIPTHLKAALVMFLSYFIAGFVPIAPYLLFGVSLAFWMAIFLSLVTLFILGVVNAVIFKVKIFSHGLEMLAIGGITILVGVLVGTFLDYI